MSNLRGPRPREDLFPGSALTPAEVEFIRAIEAFKKKYNRRYPTWSEVLHVLLSLGYRRVVLPTTADRGACDDVSTQSLVQKHPDQSACPSR